jgi:hypothetical protein
LINRLGKIDPIVTIAAKEEGFVLPDGPTHLVPKLLHANQWLRIPQRILIPLV